MLRVIYSSNCLSYPAETVLDRNPHPSRQLAALNQGHLRAGIMWRCSGAVTVTDLVVT